ncbi:MAG: alkaline phosphatase D family protein [Pseudoxanthomonas sp.]
MSQPADRSMPRPARRRFLKALVVAAAAAPFASRIGWLQAAEDAVGFAVSRTHFPQSVASGDPRPDRVLLWTRAPDASGQAVPLRLQVADDAQFQQLRVERDLVARAEADHCLRVRVRELQPGRRYFYRFLRRDGDTWLASPTGRTRTAPAAEAPTPPLKFGFISCQDYGGRWYNSLMPLLEEAPDFVLHLGDFIYESVGDESFQSVGGERNIVFDDQAGALPVAKKNGGYLAARSLDNYRQLHRHYRTDPMLQALLESAPLVAIWDDHEFSDDCWQDHSAYSNGRRDEGDRARRRNAEHAYFEYMPVDVEVGASGDDGTLAVDDARLHPHTRLWRALDFGRDLRLVLLDYRSQRPDHAIPEDAFPGALAYDQAALRRLLPLLGLDPGAMASKLMPYLDLADEAWKPLRKPLLRALTRAYTDQGIEKHDAVRRARAASTTPMAVMALRGILQRYNAAVPGFMQAELPPAEGDYPRGLPWLALGKSKLFSHIGSRYLVVKDSYDLLLALREAEGKLPLALGEAQQAWLLAQLASSRARWKVVASSVSMTSMVLDMARPEMQAPPMLQRKFYLNVDQWDGFGRQRDALVKAMDEAGGTVVLSGDIHAGFATQLSQRTVEFTVPAVSSQTLKDILAGSAGDDPDTADTGRRLVEALDGVIAGGDARIRHAQTSRHGAGLIEIGAEGDLRASFFELPAETCRQCLYEQPAAMHAQLQRIGFAVAASDRALRPDKTGPPTDSIGKSAEPRRGLAEA